MDCTSVVSLFELPVLYTPIKYYNLQEKKLVKFVIGWTFSPREVRSPSRLEKSGTNHSDAVPPSRKTKISMLNVLNVVPCKMDIKE